LNGTRPKYLPTHFRPESGQALIEFAMIAPVVVLPIFGILQFGLLFSWKNVLNNAAREGARAGSVCQTDSQIQDVVARNYSILPAAGTVHVDITSLDTAGNQLVTNGVTTDLRQRGGTVIVTLTYPARVIRIPGVLSDPKTLTAQASFRTECSYTPP
jgi:Flp pilus assembly protein TadG